MTRFIIPTLLALALTIGAAWFGWTQLLGAHPLWSTQIAFIGAPIGAVLGWLAMLRIKWLRGFVMFALLTVGAFAVAHYGKTAFAASFAENRFAGMLWYYGWIATAVFTAAAIFSAAFRPPQ